MVGGMKDTRSLSCADHHAVSLFVTMMLMEARQLTTREERVAFMSGQRFCGPHFRLTRDEVQITPEVAEYAADLIAAEEAKAKEAA